MAKRATRSGIAVLGFMAAVGGGILLLHTVPPKTPPAPPRDRLGILSAPPEASARAGGVLISKVRRGGPASSAGLMTGDVVVEFAGERTQRREDLLRVIAATPPGSFVPISYRRRDETLLTVMRLP